MTTPAFEKLHKNGGELLVWGGMDDDLETPQLPHGTWRNVCTGQLGRGRCRN